MAIPELSKLYTKYEEISYDKMYGPTTPDSIAEADKKANCQKFASDALETYFGVKIPSGCLSKEIYEGAHGLFESKELGEEELGDIFILGPDGEEAQMDARSFHLTFYGGERDNNNSPILDHFHGNAKQTGIKHYSLDVFQDEKHRHNYGKVWGIRRLVPDKILTLDQSMFPTDEEVMEYYS